MNSCPYQNYSRIHWLKELLIYWTLIGMEPLTFKVLIIIEYIFRLELSLEFIEGVSQFSVQGDTEKKLKCERGRGNC